MSYLLINEIESALNRAKHVEVFLRFGTEEGYRTLEWFHIEKEKAEYVLCFHRVFDDSEDFDSIYDFSYVEPDDLYGLEVKRGEVLAEIMDYLTVKGVDCEKFVFGGELEVLL